MLTFLVVLAVRALVLLVVFAAVAAAALLVRRRLRRAGHWHRVQEVLRSQVLPQRGCRPATGWRHVAVRALDRWLDGGARR